VLTLEARLISVRALVKGGLCATPPLPGNANLEQLKKGAKSFQRAVRAGVAEVVREFHPRLSYARPGSPALSAFTRTDAQLVIARQFGFSGWPKLEAHLELVARYARSPHEQPVGGPLTDEQAIIDEFLQYILVLDGKHALVDGGWDIEATPVPVTGRPARNSRLGFLSQTIPSRRPRGVWPKDPPPCFRRLSGQVDGPIWPTTRNRTRRTLRFRPGSSM
jgi:hypothetical protein